MFQERNLVSTLLVVISYKFYKFAHIFIFLIVLFMNIFLITPREHMIIIIVCMDIQTSK